MNQTFVKIIYGNWLFLEWLYLNKCHLPTEAKQLKLGYLQKMRMSKIKAGLLTCVLACNFVYVG